MQYSRQYEDSLGITGISPGDEGWHTPARSGESDRSKKTISETVLEVSREGRNALPYIAREWRSGQAGRVLSGLKALLQSVGSPPSGGVTRRFARDRLARSEALRHHACAWG